MRKALLYRLAAEIITGRPTPNESRWQFDRGHEFEPQARALYEFETDVEVEQVGLLRGDVPRTHVSPDGLVGDDGMIEIKTMMPHVFAEAKDTGKIDLAHDRQCQMSLWVSGRRWVDLCYFCPEWPVSGRILIQRQEPRPEAKEEIKTAVSAFLDDLEALVEKLQ